MGIIVLVDRWGCMLQFFHHERLGRFLGGQGPHGRVFSQLAKHLPVVLRVERVLRLLFRKLFVEVTGLGKLALLNIGVGEQLHHFGQVRAVSCLVQEPQHGGERLRIVANPAYQGVQRVMQGIGATREETVGVPIVEFKCIFDAMIGDKPIGQGTDAAHIVMHSHQFAGQGLQTFGVAGVEFGAQKGPQSIGPGIEIWDLFEILDGSDVVARG